MPRILPTPKTLSSIDGFLTSITGKSAGRYAFICGTPPTGINIGDVFDWDGSSAVLNTPYAKLPPSLFSISENESYSKASSTWSSDATLNVLGVVASQAELAGKAAGIYAANAAFGVTAKGDIVYYPGGGASCKPYLLYGDTRSIFYTSTGETYAKFSGGWLLVAASKMATYTEKLSLSSTGVVSPTKGTTTVDYLSLVDDGSGWCNLTGALNQITAGTAGDGTLLVNVPATWSGSIDPTFHPYSNQTNTLSGAGEVFRIIPGSWGTVSRSDGAAQTLMVVPHGPRQVKLMGAFGISAGPAFWNYLDWDYFQLSGIVQFQFSCRFKKT